MAGSYSMELSNGQIVENPGEGEILSLLQRFGKDLDTCNFTYGGSAGGWIGVYGDAASGLYLMYNDVQGEEVHSQGCDPQKVCSLLLQAAQGNGQWSEDPVFQGGGAAPLEGAAAAEGARSGGQKTSESEGSFGVGSLKEELLKGAKRAVSREASYGVSRIIRKGLRGILGKRF